MTDETTGDILEVDASALDWTPERTCMNYDTCGNEPPPTLEICDECLDAARERDRNAAYDDYAEYLNEVLP